MEGMRLEHLQMVLLEDQAAAVVVVILETELVALELVAKVIMVETL